MANCKLTSSITKESCNYSVAGVKAVYLFNYDIANQYTIGDNQGISEIKLAEAEKIHRIEFIDNTASFSDELAVNGNGGKYRTHTLNFNLSSYDYNILNQGDALSLGKFTAIVQDNQDRFIILGRNNGLSASAFNYDSGAAADDANGWTVTMAGTELEIARLLESYDVIKDLLNKTTVTP